MPKVKTLLVILLVITFSFSLLGCGLITSRTASTDEVVETGGQVPEWLLLSHRSIASEENEIDEDEDEETDEAVSGVDQDNGDTADTGQTEQATSEVAQAAESGSSGGTQHQTSEQQEPSPSGDPVSDVVAKIVPGTREYNEYLQKRKPGETPEQWVEREIKEQQDKQDTANEEGVGHWFDDKESPSGFGN